MFFVLSFFRDDKIGFSETRQVRRRGSVPAAGGMKGKVVANHFVRLLGSSVGRRVRSDPRLAVDDAIQISLVYFLDADSTPGVAALSRVQYVGRTVVFSLRDFTRRCSVAAAAACLAAAAAATASAAAADVCYVV